MEGVECGLVLLVAEKCVVDIGGQWVRLGGFGWYLEVVVVEEYEY